MGLSDIRRRNTLKYGPALANVALARKRGVPLAISAIVTVVLAVWLLPSGDRPLPIAVCIVAGTITLGLVVWYEVGMMRAFLLARRTRMEYNRQK
jgi:hypothetical protein